MKYLPVLASKNLAALVLLISFPSLLVGCAETSAQNDCLIQAARVQSELPRNAWSRLLLVKYNGQGLGHVYAIYELPGHRIFAYDTVFGSRRISPRSLHVADVLRAADMRAKGGKYLEDTYAGAPLAR